MKRAGLLLSLAAAITAGIAAIAASAVRFDTSPIMPTRNAGMEVTAIYDGDDSATQFTQTLLQRPLFNSTRRPFVPAPMEPVAAPSAEMEIPQPVEEARPDIRLFGIVKIAGRSLALVSEGNQSPARWVGSGGSIGNWTLAAIGQNSITIVTASDRTQQMTVSMSDAAPMAQGNLPLE